MHADAILAPLFAHTMAQLPAALLFDAHTHIGANDPDDFRCSSDELLGALAAASSRAVVFPMQEPTGYRKANDAVLAAAAASEGRLVAFCRLDPRAGARARRRRGGDQAPPTG